MCFGEFSLPCVDYSRLQLQCYTGIQIILCKYRNISTSTNMLQQTCNQEDFTLEVYNTSVQLGIFESREGFLE